MNTTRSADNIYYYYYYYHHHHRQCTTIILGILYNYYDVCTGRRPVCAARAGAWDPPLASLLRIRCRLVSDLSAAATRYIIIVRLSRTQRRLGRGATSAGGYHVLVRACPSDEKTEFRSRPRAAPSHVSRRPVDHDRSNRSVARARSRCRDPQIFAASPVIEPRHSALSLPTAASARVFGSSFFPAAAAGTSSRGPPRTREIAARPGMSTENGDVWHDKASAR